MENTTTFDELGVIPQLTAALGRKNITAPSPIQHQAIPSALEGKDIVGIAQTGTGKTFAFGLPMIQRLSQSPRTYGIVVAPTRELALQIEESMAPIAAAMNLKTVVLIGGESMGRQIGMLRSHPRIIIGTPGRIIDHAKRRTLPLHMMSIVVLDEADRMLDMGFAPQIKEIMDKVSPERQTMLFSATMPHEIMKIATTYMSIPLRIEVAPAGTTVNAIEQEVFVLDKKDKYSLLKKLLTEHPGTVLVFSRTKRWASRLCMMLREDGFTAGEIHADRSLSQRKFALAQFKNGRQRILIATDIAARGIDVNNIELVINYDLPENSEDYVHRIGRTGRAGKMGKAVSFADPMERGKVISIERLIRKAIPKTRVNARGETQPFVPESEYNRGPRSRGRYSSPYGGSGGGRRGGFRRR